jgi:hypothetical protein
MRLMLAVCVAALLLPSDVIAGSDGSDGLDARGDPPPVAAAAQPPSCDCVGQRRTLTLLSAGFAALEAYDTFSTLRLVGKGAAEQNPLMTGLVTRPAAFVTVKSVVTLTSIVAAEQLWREHHRAAAIALMAISTSVMGVTAVHNQTSLRAIQ